MIPDQNSSEAESLKDVLDFFGMKRSFEKAKTSPPDWRTREARTLLAHALDIVRLMCGPDVLALAYGTPIADDRKSQLLALADRLQWAALLFSDVAPAARDGGFNALAVECESLAHGDAPRLLAKLANYRKKVRLLAAKFRANRWDAYLDGLEIETAARHSALANAFGQGWDTMSRWPKEAAATWGSKPIDERLLLDRHRGAEHLRRFGPFDEAGWRQAIERSGRVFRRQAGYSA